MNPMRGSTQRRPGLRGGGGREVSLSSVGKRGQRKPRFVRDRQGPCRRPTAEGRETNTVWGGTRGDEARAHTHTHTNNAFINV